MGDDPERRRPDISKAKTLLNWEPEYSLTQGLSKTRPYFRTKLGIK
jgi:nucleoside-diphosphate-sugar epimerase